MKKAVNGAFMLFLAALLLLLQVGAKGGALHWYCTKNQNHRQMIAAPELQFIEKYGGYYVDHEHGDDNEDRVVYLTFDAGYENGNVAKILDTLRDKQASGAFFVLEHLVKDNTDLVRRMEAEGHLVCNHSAKHPDLSLASPEKIENELRALEKCCAENGIKLSPYFRPPEGNFSEGMMQTASGLGYKTIFWSFAYADWDNKRQPDAQRALKNILDHLHNGEILLLHPTSATNAAILSDLIDGIRAAGYRFGTLDELCGAP